MDPSSGEVRALGKEAAPADLDEAVERSARRRARVEDGFAAALEAERRRKEELERAFRKAAEKAKDGPIERPDEDRWR
ncbi:MAG: hypothetical protein D6702_01045 [Planctomycetota bacterium]|nr:MAG: hypothetical protein D6702_01045 [Planctomycetota bacterium]